MMKRALAVVLLVMMVGCSKSAPVAPVGAPAPPVSEPAPSLPPKRETPIITATIVPKPAAIAGTFRTAFADEQNGWLANEMQLSSTADGGRTWQPLHTFDSPIYGAQLLTPQVGWVSTNNGLYATRDGGKTWIQLSAEHFVYNSFQFITEQVGWMRIAEKGLFRTTDGGKSWAPIAGPCEPVGAMHFVTVETGFALCAIGGGAGIGLKEMHRTDDAGQTWRRVATTGKQDGSKGNMPWGSYLSDFYMLDANNGWVGGAKGDLIATHDGGTTWEQLPGHGLTWNSVRFFTPQRGVAVLTDGQVWDRSTLVATQDGGKHWAPVYPQGPAEPSVMKRADAGLWVAVGTVADPKALLFRHEYDGYWERVGALPDQSIAFSFLGRENGWAAVGRSLLRTQDGGKTWQEVASDIGITQMDFVDLQTGYISRFPQAPLQVTRDGGRTFTSLGLDASFMRFVSPTLGWVLVGEKIKATTDGGASWKDLTLPRAHPVSFDLLPDGTALLLAGAPTDPDLFFTTDGGASWTAVGLTESRRQIRAVKLSSSGQAMLWDTRNRTYCTIGGFQTWAECQ